VLAFPNTAAGLTAYLSKVRPIAKSAFVGEPSLTKAAETLARLTGGPDSWSTAVRILSTISVDNARIAADLSAIRAPTTLRSGHEALIRFFQSQSRFEKVAATAASEHSSAGIERAIAAIHPGEPSYDAGRTSWLRAVAGRLHAEAIGSPDWLAKWVIPYQ
jgi:hypothetical protein